MGHNCASPVMFQLWYFAGGLCSESIRQDLTGYSCCPYAVYILIKVKNSKRKAWRTLHQALDSGDQG